MSEYPELNINRLKKRASRWAEEFPVIQSVELFQAERQKDRSYKYILYVSIRKQDPEYYSWAFEECLHVEDDLISSYKKNKSFAKNEAIITSWFWFTAIAGSPIPERMVEEDSRIVLYSDVVEDAPEAECMPIEVDNIGKIEEEEYYFIRENSGDWKISFGDEKTGIRHLEGVSIIAFLLEHPNKEFYPYDINVSIGKIDPSDDDAYVEGRAVEEGLSIEDLRNKKIKQPSPFLREERKGLEEILYGKNVSHSNEVEMPFWDDFSPKQKRATKSHYRYEYGVRIYNDKETGELKYSEPDARLCQENDKELDAIYSNITAFAGRKDLDNLSKGRILKMPKLRKYIHDHINQKNWKYSFKPDPEDMIQWKIKRE